MKHQILWYPKSHLLSPTPSKWTVLIHKSIAVSLLRIWDKVSLLLSNSKSNFANEWVKWNNWKWSDHNSESVCDCRALCVACLNRFCLKFQPIYLTTTPILDISHLLNSHHLYHIKGNLNWLPIHVCKVLIYQKIDQFYWTPAYQCIQEFQIL